MWFDFFRVFRRRPALDEASRNKIAFLEKLLGYRIEHPALYLRALRHRSKLGDGKLERVESYERLEFLGDAVLDLSSTELLFEAFPKEDEGVLTKYRALLVKGDALARYALKLNLPEVVDVSRRARSQNVQFSDNVLADVFEALIGAVFKDRGYDAARAFSQRVLREMVDFSELRDNQDNYKSELLEYTQSHRMAQPEYVIAASDGPDHDKTFDIEVYVEGRLLGRGAGKSKKRAEQIAAKAALKTMGLLS